MLGKSIVKQKKNSTIVINSISLLLFFMKDDITLLEQEFQKGLSAVCSDDDIQQLEITFLGRRGKLQELFQIFASLPKDEKKEYGQKINALKQRIQNDIEQKKKESGSSSGQSIDVTLKKGTPPISCLHPLSKVMEETIDIFVSMGFDVWEGTEVDTDYNNFQTLNIPENHPARDMQDTFYLEKEPYVLRTHTSNMQTKIMGSKEPPIQAIVPGRCFRYEATDASHDMTFYQVEGMMVGENISIASMRYVMETFLKALFKKDVTTRLRPGYFPFVEPGLELDFSCTVCDGKGCRLCSHTGWVEFMGCGMTHPNVYKEAGVDPEKYTGFAFGFGLTRLVMMRYKIDDIRLLHSGDIRFLKQFA